MSKVVVISGGSDGLGKEIAKKLLPKNKVVILSQSKSKTISVAKELNCDFQVCNVSLSDEVRAAVKNIIRKYKKIDCLINNAGVWIEGELDSNDYEGIKAVLDINTLGTIYLTKAVIHHMKRHHKGLIVNIISQAGLQGKTERSVYTASKFAITGFTKSIQPELAKYNIAVTGIYPGKMKTKMFEKVGVNKKMDDALDPKEVAKTIEFLLSFDSKTLFTEIGIKYINN